MTTPVSCIPSKRTEPWWLQRHADKLHEKTRHNNQFDIVVLGDSIVHAWEMEGAQAWEEHFGHLKTLNLGFAGDCTEHLLWRIQNGQVESLQADYIVLLIGTNNAGHRFDTPEQIARGIELILNSIRQQLPSAKIILTAIFPRSRNPRKKLRKMVDDTNSLIKLFAKGESIQWFDINSLFLDKDGMLKESVMPDLLHPNSQQYEIWAKQLVSEFSLHTPTPRHEG